MLRVKVCGITRAADAHLACELGADAIGFIFYHKSPRYLAPAAAAAIAAALPPHVARVGVFADPSPGQVREAIEGAGLDFVQLHGAHRFDDFAAYAPARIICAVNLQPQESLDRLWSYQGHCDALLLDGFKPGQYGGTGRTVDWALAKQARQVAPLLLAGGLSPANVAEAVAAVAPAAVDVNSGIEDAPGQKNHDKLQSFFQQLQDYRRDWQPASERKNFLA